MYCFAEEVPSTDSSTFFASNIGNATLHVPASSVDVYKDTAPWRGFKEVVPLTTQELSVGHVVADGKNVVSRYSLNGVRSEQQAKGLNILRMNDGTVRKVVIK